MIIRIEPVAPFNDVVPSIKTQSLNSTGNPHGSVRKSVTNISKFFIIARGERLILFD